MVETERETVPFYVDDETGRALVDPEGARIDTEKRETERVEAGSSEYDYDRETTRKEVRVPDEGNIYVFGSAGWSDEHGQIAIQDGDAPFFKISGSSESELTGRYRTIAVLSAVTALVGLPIGSWLVLGASGVL